VPDWKRFPSSGMPSIWLTGSRGFVGRKVAAVLKKAGARLHCFTNRQGEGDCSGPCLPMNYRDPKDINASVKALGLPDIFIHLGWGEMDKPESALHLTENVPAGQNLIKTLFDQGLKTFIFVGSMNEYGGRTGLLSEDMEPEGRLTNYAKAKIEVAQYGFQSARTYGKSFLHARTFYVYGAGQRQGSLINDLYHAYQTGAEANLSPCEHYRDYIHVSEVAEGLRLLTDVQESTTVNLGSGNAVEVKDFVLRFWKILGGDPGRLKFGARQLRGDEPEQPKSYADLTRLKNLVHWTPSLSLDEGIGLTIKELKPS
jgi:nucleoside-diphosphate-sugar epimerase